MGQYISSAGISMRVLGPIRIFRLLEFTLLLVLSANAEVRAQENAKDEKADLDQNESIFANPIEDIIKNPLISRGLVTGVDALNRSVDSLMEAVFYSLMDNSIGIDIEGGVSFGADVSRKLYTTSIGRYVVIDNIGVGPKYLQDISKFVPFQLKVGADLAINLTNIYTRTDGQRLVDKESLSKFRWYANNWFGILPFLTRILPPSFNPNELYDPIKQLHEPFMFPSTLEALQKMPRNSIRSYSVTGGIFLSSEWLSRVYAESKETLERSLDIAGRLPTSVFVRGDYRINVLKKSETSVWVGLTRLSRAGQSILNELGRTFFLLSDFFSWWQGVPGQFFPIEANVDFSKAIQYDQMFAFDLKDKPSRQAYLQAVRGSFTKAYELLKNKKVNSKNGKVKRLFKREKNSIEHQSKTGNNFFVFNQRRDYFNSHAQLEITDDYGKYYILQAKASLGDTTWDSLIGRQKVESFSQADIQVDKVKVKDAIPIFGNKHKFLLSKGKNPIRLSLNMVFRDDYTYVNELRSYLRTISKFTGKNMGKYGKFPLRDAAADARKRLTLQYADPDDSIMITNNTPLLLGRFQANTRLEFDTNQLDKILASSKMEMTKAFEDSYSVEYRDTFVHILGWLKYSAALPLEFFNYRDPAWDSAKEIHSGVASLMQLKRSSNPMDKLDGFFDLFATSYPENLAHALLMLSNKSDIPVKVSLQTRAKGGLKGKAFEDYTALNGLVIMSENRFPPKAKQDVAEEMLSAFYPQSLGVEVASLAIRNLRLYTVTNKAKGETEKINIAITLNESPNEYYRVYVKLEQDGKLQVGKLKLFEQVMSARVSKNNQGVPVLNLTIWKPDSGIDNFVTSQALRLGGKFRLLVAVSEDGNKWSDERQLQFEMKGFKIIP